MHELAKLKISINDNSTRKKNWLNGRNMLRLYPHAVTSFDDTNGRSTKEQLGTRLIEFVVQDWKHHLFCDNHVSKC